MHTRQHGHPDSITKLCFSNLYTIRLFNQNMSSNKENNQYKCCFMKIKGFANANQRHENYIHMIFSSS